MRYLGIDYGTKRVGLALSDSEGRMAFPKAVIENTPLLVEKISELLRGESVGLVVLGESKNYHGQHNPIMKDIAAFREKLSETTGVRIVYEPEVLSSREAMHIQGDNEMNDASAAAIVLQSYLDRVNGPFEENDEE